MSDRIIAMLNRTLVDVNMRGVTDPETRRNALRETLQLCIMDYVYHHPTYSKWIMYGGSALRILHGLNRLSVDLDFEVGNPVTDAYLATLADDLRTHLRDNYGATEDFLKIKITRSRGLTMKFVVGSAVPMGTDSPELHLKIDLNYFVPERVVTEVRPVSTEQFAFAIRTYNMSALMASKIVAIFQRGTRGAGEDGRLFEGKGRDWYDLLWYMEKRVVPDFDYLSGKNVDIGDPRTLFDKLTLQMNMIEDDLLRLDLPPLFPDKQWVANWIHHWRDEFLRLVERYRLGTVKELRKIRVFEDYHRDVFMFHFDYETDQGAFAVVYEISDLWFSKKPSTAEIDTDVERLFEYDSNGASSHPVPTHEMKKFATLFLQKNRGYFTKTKDLSVGDRIVTKLIRRTGDNLDRRKEILLSESTLRACELDDLLP